MGGGVLSESVGDLPMCMCMMMCRMSCSICFLAGVFCESSCKCASLLLNYCILPEHTW